MAVDLLARAGGDEDMAAFGLEGAGIGLAAAGCAAGDEDGLLREAGHVDSFRVVNAASTVSYTLRQIEGRLNALLFDRRRINRRLPAFDEQALVERLVPGFCGGLDRHTHRAKAASYVLLNP